MNRTEMKNILEIKEGLPKDKILTKSLLEQYNVGKLRSNLNGTLIFPDGSIFMLTRDDKTDSYKWIDFTRLKLEGIKLLEDLIRNEFSKLDEDNLQISSSQNILVWKSFLDGEASEVHVASGAYSNLPSVFKKIDNLINQYMYKMNER